jgi:hypothetical protein
MYSFTWTTLALSIKDLCMPVAIQFRMFVYERGTSAEVRIWTKVLSFVRYAYKSVLYLSSSEETERSQVKDNSDLLATEHRMWSAGTVDNCVMLQLAHPQVCYG